MTLASYCKGRGMTVDQYEQTKTIIEDAATKIFEKAVSLHKPDTGMYYPATEILSGTTLQPYIIAALKKKGMEFMDNNTLYRI